MITFSWLQELVSLHLEQCGKDLFENPGWSYNEPSSSCDGYAVHHRFAVRRLFHTELVETHDNFHYHQAISRERQEDGSKGLYVGQMVDKKYDDVFGPILTSERGLMYLCGLLGMQFGIYQLFAERGITDAYMTIKDELKDIPCSRLEP